MTSLVHVLLKGFTPTLIVVLFLTAFPALGMNPSTPAYAASSLVKSTTGCPLVLLTQNVNGLNGPYTFNLWALEGCAITKRVDLTLTYSFALFGINTTTGVAAGSGFVLEKATETKGSPGYTDLSLILYRAGQPSSGELLASFTVQPSIVFPIVGSGTLEWTDFRVDSGEDISGQISTVQIARAVTPSQPVPGLPDPITGESVGVHWFPNPDSEAVTAYTLSVSDSSGEVASMVVPATQTAATLSGLSYGTPYTLGLTATNAEGDSPLAALLFTTRYDENASQRDLLLEQFSHDWNPDGTRDGSLQSLISSPADMDLDGLVNAVDVLEVIKDHFGRVSP